MAGGMKKGLPCSQLPVILTHTSTDLCGETVLILTCGLGGFCLSWLAPFALGYVTRPHILSEQSPFFTFQSARDDGELGEAGDGDGFSVERLLALKAGKGLG